MHKKIMGIVWMLCLCLLSGCKPQSMTMDLEGMALDASGQAMIQAMEEYQASSVESYSYPVIGPWIQINRTAAIQGAEDDEVMVVTRNEKDQLEWRSVQYVYPFFESISLSQGSSSEEDPLVVAPLIVSPDGLAVAYQALHSQGRFLEIAEVGRPTVLVGSDGRIYPTDADLDAGEDISWDLVKAGWSSDGRYLLFYRTDNWQLGSDEIDLEFALEEEGQSSSSSQSSQEGNKGVMLTMKDIYGYDRKECRVEKIWEAMRLYLPAAKVPDPDIVADVLEEDTALFLLFDEKEDCLDVKLWKHDGELEVSLVDLPDNPCIQMDLEQGIYYYQEQGDIWKAPLGKSGQPQRILSAGSQLQAFLMSEGEQRVFTIETREDLEDVCLYLQDEKGSWYRQVIAVGTKGACSLQLSDDQQRLLVECQTETENQALILYFMGEIPAADGSAGE